MHALHAARLHHQQPQHGGWAAQWLDPTVARGWWKMWFPPWPTEPVPGGSHSTAPPPPQPGVDESSSNAKGQGRCAGGDKGHGQSKWGAGGGQGSCPNCLYNLGARRPPGWCCQVCTGEPKAEKPRPQGRWSPVNSKWLLHLQAGSAGQLAERSQRKPGFWLSPGNHSLAVTRILGRAAFQGSPAQNPPTTWF